MKAYCHVLLLFLLVIVGRILCATEFDRRVDVSFFFQKNGTCLQASLSGSDLQDKDLDMLNPYIPVNSVSICFGGTKSQLTPKKLEGFLVQANVKELGLFDCESNLRLISTVPLSPFLTKLKVRVENINGELIEALTQIGEKGKQIDLILFLARLPDNPEMEMLGKKLKNFNSIHVNGHAILHGLK
jgi:hypothetical protein